MLWTQVCTVPRAPGYWNTRRQVAHLSLTETEGLCIGLMKTFSSGLGKAPLHPCSQGCLLLFSFFSFPDCPEHSFEEDFLLIKSFTMWLMPALCCALDSVKAALVAKQIALSQRFFRPLRRSLQLKFNVLDPRLWNLVLWNYVSQFPKSSIRVLERNCGHVYLAHLVKGEIRGASMPTRKWS